MFDAEFCCFQHMFYNINKTMDYFISKKNPQSFYGIIQWSKSEIIGCLPVNVRLSQTAKLELGLFMTICNLTVIQSKAACWGSS